MHLTQKPRLISELEILFALRLVEVFASLRKDARKKGLDQVVRIINEKGIDMSREINIILKKYDVRINYEWLAQDILDAISEANENDDNPDMIL